MANRWGNNGNSDRLYFLGPKITVDGDCSHDIKRCLPLGRKAMTNLDNILKSRDYFANKDSFGQSYGFSSSHVWMWELDHKESWEPKNWCFWTVVLEKTLASPLDCKKIKPVNPKGNQFWMFIPEVLILIWWSSNQSWSTDAESPIVWLLGTKSWLIRKYPDAGKDWR